MLLKINLLPEAFRKTSNSPLNQLYRTPLMWISVGAMAIVALLLWLPAAVHRRQLEQLTATIQQLTPKKQEVDQLQQALKRLQIQQAAFRKLQGGQGFWSRRLNTLSDVTPDGVWFTELVLDESKGLTIEGSAIGQSGSEMVSVGRLVQDLKADPGFASVVKDVQIESIKRVQEREIELVQFALTCALAQPSKH